MIDPDEKTDIFDQSFGFFSLPSTTIEPNTRKYVALFTPTGSRILGLNCIAILRTSWLGVYGCLGKIF